MNETTIVRRRKVSAEAFTRIDGVSGDLVSEATQQIRRLIEEGVFKTGQRLPSERDLAEGLGISRAILREGLSSLESLGYLETRRGGGRYVADPADGRFGPRLLDGWLRQHEAEIRDLVEMRAAVESQALRGSGEDLEVLADDIQRLISAQATAMAAGLYAEAAECDIQFHIRLAWSSSNEPLRSLAIALIGKARQAAYASYRVASYRKGSLRQHRSIAAAIERGDIAGAADRLMEHHLSRIDQLATYLEHSET